jgi:hypothetical protein
MKEIQLINIHDLLAKRRQIAAIWSIEDMQALRPDLTDDEAWEVLRQVDRRHDAEVGITWTTLECIADILFNPASGPSSDRSGV